MHLHCGNKCIDAFSQAKRAVLNQHFISVRTKNVNERREAQQCYLLGCMAPADEGDPAAKKRKVNREKYATNKDAAKPESPYINCSFMYSFLGKYICVII